MMAQFFGFRRHGSCDRKERRSKPETGARADAGCKCRHGTLLAVRRDAQKEDHRTEDGEPVGGACRGRATSDGLPRNILRRPVDARGFGLRLAEGLPETCPHSRRLSPAERGWMTLRNSPL